jgi:CNT family concentrative nucleoside transporter
MEKIVHVVAMVMQRTMGTSGAESLSAAANIFVGQTEAPLVIGPFVKDMTRSELHAVMTGGFATVAGGVMAVYVGFLKDIPGIAGHLVAASIMSAPAALAISKVMYPEDETPVTAGTL